MQRRKLFKNMLNCFLFVLFCVLHEGGITSACSSPQWLNVPSAHNLYCIFRITHPHHYYSCWCDITYNTLQCSGSSPRFQVSEDLCNDNLYNVQWQELSMRFYIRKGTLLCHLKVQINCCCSLYFYRSYTCVSLSNH